MSESRTKKINSRKAKQRLFLLSVWIYPAILFFVLYVYVNFNYVTMAFKKYDPTTHQYLWYGFGNFAKFFDTVFHKSDLKYALINSVSVTILSYFIMTPISILVNFAVYKKIFMSEFFKTVFFIPSVIAGIVWIMVYRYFIEYGVPMIVKSFGGNEAISLLSKPESAYWTLMVIRFWTGIGSINLVYLGTMSRVPESLIESGKLEVMGMMSELWHITIPMIWPLLSLSFLGLVSSIFLADLGAFSWFGEGVHPRLYTFSYYLFTLVVSRAGVGSLSNYTLAAAAGLTFTVIIAPLTMLVRFLLEKYGPDAEY